MPNLRDSILRSRKGGPIQTFKEYDERGNLKVWQEGGEDMDPDQAGIQNQPYEYRPMDESQPPIMMTNIPKGGFGPSLDQPGGVPGSSSEREEFDAQAAATPGAKVVDLSTPKKDKMPGQPPAWVSPDVDLNAPGERDRFKQGFREDVFKGINLPDINPSEEAAKKWDPAIYPKEYKQLHDQLSQRVSSARTIEDRIMAEFDKNAAIQASTRKHKTEAAEKKQTEIKGAQEKYLKLRGDKLKLAEDYSKIQSELGDMTAIKSPEYIETMNTRLKGITDQIGAIDIQAKDLESKYPIELQGISSVAPDVMKSAHETTKPKQAAAGAEDFKPKDPTPVANQYKKPVKDVAADQVRASSLAAEARKSGITDKAAIRKYVEGKMGGVGTKDKASAQDKQVKSQQPKLAEKNMKELVMEFKKDVGLGSGNWKAFAKFAADAGGFTLEELYLKPVAEIKRLLLIASKNQDRIMKEIGP